MFYQWWIMTANQFQGIVVEVNDDNVVMDFNHPLAGKDLNFSGSYCCWCKTCNCWRNWAWHVHGTVDITNLIISV